MKLIKMKCENCGATLEVNKDLDKIHCNFCGAEVLIDDEATNVKRVEEAKLKARKENHDQDLKERNSKLEQDLKEKEILDKANAKEIFKKSKFSKVLLVFFAIAVLFFFVGTGFLVKALTLVQAALFICSWLMGMEIINEPKKGLRIILAILAFVLIVPIIGTGGESSSTKLEKINWKDIEMKELLPEPSLNKGHIYSNEKNHLSLEYGKAKKDNYKEYVEKCKDMKYELEVDEDSDSYEAFNSDGYKLRVSYSDYSKELSIVLDAPEDMKEFEWPTNGLGSKVPKTESNYGRISLDNDESFIVHVGKTTLEEYNTYVKKCEDKGFTENHSKSEKSFKATNSEGIEVHLMYLGGNVIEVSVSAKSSENDSTEEETTKPTEDTTKKDETSNGLRSDFKKAMDSYESFMNEYVDFMKKYQANPSDTSLLKDYAKYLEKYTKFVSDFDKWEEEDMNDAETKYYLEVQSRVLKKLSEVQ